MSVIGRKLVWVKNVDKWAKTEQVKDFKHTAWGISVRNNNTLSVGKV
jgi:hypothetical protein